MLISIIRSYGQKLDLLNCVDTVLFSSWMLLSPLVLPFGEESIFSTSHSSGATVSGGIYSKLDPCTSSA